MTTNTTGAASENGSTSAVTRDTAEGSKNRLRLVDLAKAAFRGAKAITEPKPDAPQPKRSRKGETAGEFRRLARRCSRRYDARADFKGRASILSRSFSIPAEVHAMAVAHVSALLNDLNNDGGSDFDDGIDASREYISPQP